MEEKIALLNLSEAEIVKLPKFMASLAFVTKDEISLTKEFLSSKGITITQAHEITIFANPLDEIKRKFSILEEVHVSDIYIQNPIMLNKNAIEIYKKVNYCIQNNVPYKKEDGTYEQFLFSESEWQKVFNKDAKKEELSNLDQTLITIDPVIESSQLELTQELENPELEESVAINPALEVYPNAVDIKDYMATDEISEDPTMTFASLEDSVNKMHSEMEDFEPSTDSLTEAKKQILEFQQEQLENYKKSFASNLASNLDDEFVGFGDIDPESYSMGRAA